MSSHNSKQRIVVELADAIENMREELRRAFGVDFAFVVYGCGNLLAADNCVEGRVYANPLPEEPETVHVLTKDAYALKREPK